MDTAVRFSHLARYLFVHKLGAAMALIECSMVVLHTMGCSKHTSLLTVSLSLIPTADVCAILLVLRNDSDVGGR